MSKYFHFIGIGGIGMSSIAQLLIKQGNVVSGSDIKESDIISRLRKQGARINIGHNPSNIEDPDVVVYSSAINQNNIELLITREKNITILKRAQMLAMLMEGKTCITVAGAHGKTTTTSLISFMLTEADFSPTVSIGGIICNFDENAWLGDSPYFVSEVDESDGSFLSFSPFYSIITNIDYEHVDYYRSWKNILDAYKHFIMRTDPNGCIFAWGEDEVLRGILKSSKRKYITFGLSKDCDVHAVGILIENFLSSFTCVHKKKKMGEITVNLPGRHNILNSLAAISLGLELGIDFDKLQQSIYNCKGVRRRFQIKARINDIVVVDDYGHHPTEIRATLETAKNIDQKRVIVIFQPHRYTRTKYLFDSFIDSLALSEYLIITDIYAANEEPIPNIKAEDLYQRLKKNGHKNVFFYSKEKIMEHLLGVVKPGDLVLTLGAGDIGKLSDELVQRLKKNN